MGKYRKFVVALVGAAVLIVGRHYGVNSEWYGDLVILATAGGVYVAPNDPR